MSEKNEILVIIDPQNDFMDSPNYTGSLAVKGAYNDMLRLVERIKLNPPSDIVITLDTHTPYHIAHPLAWINTEGKNPDPYTVITVDDVMTGVWKASNIEEQAHHEFYVKQLAIQNNYELRIWPFHCIDNTIGHKVEENLQNALNEWEASTGKKVIYIRKGLNNKTENYSVFKAEVVLEDDIDTHLNTKLINMINSYKKVIFAGEASSHCVGGSVMHYLENIPKEDISKTTILKDCTSPVTGFENDSEKFFQNVVSLGAKLANALDGKRLKM